CAPPCRQVSATGTCASSWVVTSTRSGATSASMSSSDVKCGTASSAAVSAPPTSRWNASWGDVPVGAPAAKAGSTSATSSIPGIDVQQRACTPPNQPTPHTATRSVPPRLQPQLEELGVDRVVVVVGRLVARVVEVDHVQGPAVVVGGRAADDTRDFLDREDLGQLVEDAVLARLRRVAHREVDAHQRVADVDVAADLIAAPVDGQRMPHHRLHAESVEHGA